jgi:predicted nucleic-acid-binding Zn-ribbon protein
MVVEDKSMQVNPREGIVAAFVIVILIGVMVAISIQGREREGATEHGEVKQVEALHQGLKCPKCSGDMEYGFVVDRGHGSNIFVSAWQQGMPQQDWTIVKADNPKPIATFHCKKCGYLESYTQ